MTVIEFSQAIWNDTQPVGYILVGIWIIIMSDYIEKRHHAKVKGQEGQVISPQEKGLDELQHIYQDTRLPQNDGTSEQRKVRYMPQDIRVQLPPGRTLST